MEISVLKLSRFALGPEKKLNHSARTAIQPYTPRTKKLGHYIVSILTSAAPRADSADLYSTLPFQLLRNFSFIPSPLTGDLYSFTHALPHCHSFNHCHSFTACLLAFLCFSSFSALVDFDRTRNRKRKGIENEEGQTHRPHTTLYINMHSFRLLLSASTAFAAAIPLPGNS
jgi:hypothetical protein